MIQVVMVAIGDERSCRIMGKTEFEAYRASPPDGESILFDFHLDEARDPEVVNHTEKLLLEDKLLRRGIARLLGGVFARSIKYEAERLGKAIGKVFGK